jgi:hypothetical protein
MPTKSNGPLMEDYIRALRAAKRMGVKAVRIEVGKGAIVMMMDDTYLEKLALGQPFAPNVEEAKREPHNWKDW